MALGECGMLAYLTYMADRLEEMHRLLKDNGSIWLHCDRTAGHYLKILMDAIFGVRNDAFRNEVIWCYKRMAANKQRQFSRVHDNLFWYSKGREWTFNVDAVRLPYADSSLERAGYEKTSLGGAAPSSGVCELNPGGRFPEDWWDIPVDWWDIPFIRPNAKERLKYPTQKPIALLSRIIQACSNRGDVVLDPFCGCGTAVDAARQSGRRWIGIDISAFAIDLVRERRLKDKTIPAYGIPADMAGARKLAEDRPFDFESWAVSRLPGFAPNMKQRGDGGIDGRGRLVNKPDGMKSRLALAQIKGGHFTIDPLRAFARVMDKNKAALGYYITLDPVTTRGARQEAASMGHVTIGATPYRRLTLWPIRDYFDGRLPSMPPMLDPYNGKPLAQHELF